MITLAIDSCDRKGSVGVRVAGQFLGLQVHGEEEYSSWLLPAVENSLKESGKQFREVDLLAATTGPGSFTGVRVGLCAVKAWAEVYGRPVVGVSRLEAIAKLGTADGWVTSTYDAHRGQIFAGLYQRAAGKLNLIEAEMVIAPEQFLQFVGERTKGEPVEWVSLDTELIRGLGDWAGQQRRGSWLLDGNGGVAHSVAQIAEARAAVGQYTDVLRLDANYVRRSDAEIYWKGPAHRGC